MDTPDFRKDWLIGNAVVAFVGALLSAEVGLSSIDTYQLPSGVIVQTFPDPVYFVLTAFFLLLSLTLVVAFIIPRSCLPCWVLPAFGTFSGALDVVVWIAFVQVWATVFPKFPDQGWVDVLEWSSLAIFLVLTFRLGHGVWRIAKRLK